MIKSRRMRLVKHVTYMRKFRNACNILDGRSEAKKPLGSRMHMHKVNIKTDLTEVVWD
jgi:hypothetical protein